MKRHDLPWVVGLISFPIVGLLFMVVTGASPIVSAAIGAVTGAVIALGIRFAFPPTPDVDGYDADARKRVARVLASVESIERMAGQVTDPVSRQALQAGCARLPELLNSVRDHDPTGVASMAAKLNVTTSGIERTLGQYLDIQKDPDLYNNAPALLAAGQTGFVGFNSFVVDTFKRLNETEMIDYRATLAALQPLEIQQLTNGSSA